MLSTLLRSIAGCTVTVLNVNVASDSKWNVVVVMMYYMLVCVVPLGMVDTIFADVAQPDQARIVALNAHNFLKNGGHVVISVKVNFSEH